MQVNTVSPSLVVALTSAPRGASGEKKRRWEKALSPCRVTLHVSGVGRASPPSSRSRMFSVLWICTPSLLAKAWSRAVFPEEGWRVRSGRPRQPRGKHAQDQKSSG